MKLGITFLIIFPSFLLVSCGQNKSGMPEIKDPEALRKDCAQLYMQFAPSNVDQQGSMRFLGREIPTNDWPGSVQSLKPFRVMRDKYAISIWILPGGEEGGGEGYYVREGTNLPPSRSAAKGTGGTFDLQFTKYQEIDLFLKPELIQ
jgi:hypothetical protein